MMTHREYLANDYLVYNHFKAKFDEKVNSFGLPRCFIFNANQKPIVLASPDIYDLIYGAVLIEMVCSEISNTIAVPRVWFGLSVFEHSMVIGGILEFCGTVADKNRLKQVKAGRNRYN